MLSVEGHKDHRVEINKVETKNNRKDLKTKSCFLEKINEIDKYVSILTKQNRGLK